MLKKYSKIISILAVAVTTLLVICGITTALVLKSFLPILYFGIGAAVFYPFVQSYSLLLDAVANKEDASTQKPDAQTSTQQSTAHQTSGAATTTTIIDKESPLFGKAVVFTGFAPINPMRAIALAQIAADRGAEVESDVSEKVNIVVCARTYDPEGSRTAKHQKAIDLMQSGADIQIISEREFLSLAESKQVPVEI